METAMQTVQIGFQPSPCDIVVLVVDHCEQIRSALAVRLEDQGYTVIEAEDLAEASAFVGSAATPVVTISGNIGTGDQDGVACFSVVTAGSTTRYAYIYMMDGPERRRPPVLVYDQPQPGALWSHQPVKLVSLLAVVAEATARVREMR